MRTATGTIIGASTATAVCIAGTIIITTTIIMGV